MPYFCLKPEDPNLLNKIVRPMSEFFEKVHVFQSRGKIENSKILHSQKPKSFFFIQNNKVS